MTAYQVLPPLSDDDYARLKADIARHGVLVPVEYDEDSNILDGHHREKACIELGITDWPKIIRLGLSEFDKRAHARQLNLARRHLTSAQKRNLVRDQLRETPEKSSRQVASDLGVDHKTVGTQRNALEARGEIPHAENVTDTLGRVQPARKPYLMIDETPVGRTAARQRAKDLRAEQTAAKKERRAARECELGASQQAMPEQKFGVIYADPPWRLEPYSRETGLDRAADNHYPTQDIEWIKALAVPAAKDCVLYLWATAAMLPLQLEVMAAWEFAYKSHMIWGKDRIGTGYWVRDRHELLLIGTRGKPPAPAMGTQPDSFLVAPVGPHSTKPSDFVEMIERLFPTMPKIELFRRGTPRAGWSAWGNQAKPKTQEPEV